MLSDTHKYRIVYDNHGIKLYEPTGDYHMSRYVAAQSQYIYSASGATKDYLKTLATQVKAICDNEDTRLTWRTDIGTLMNNLLYRMQYPVDEDCAIRTGALYYFIDGEDPEVVNPVLTERKVELARQHPDLYTFFLSAGIVSTPSWKPIERDSLTTQYFQGRREALRNLTPYNP